MTNKTVAFSGIDGSGKSTQIKLVKDYLSNYKVMVSKINYSPLNNMGYFKLLDMILKGVSGYKIISYYYHLQKKEYNNYDYILFDRHLACYLAYAYAYGTQNIKFIRNLLNIVKSPDLTLYYDVDINTSLERIKLRGEDINKGENYETLYKAKEGYEIVFDIIDNIERIDANLSQKEVYDSTVKVLSKYKISR